MQTLRDFYYKTSVQERRLKGVGTFLGVYLPTLFTMIGALLYLPLGSILGFFGIVKTLFVLSFSLILTLITALSLSATASNMHVGDGGSYFMISRSFGLKTGAIVGIAIYIAHTLMACLCILGFSESIASFIPGVPIRLIGIVTLCMVASLSFISTTWAIRAQAVVFFLVVVSCCFLIRGNYLLTPVEPSLSTPLFSFWETFAVLYPALIGIEAGAALSGDLKKPRLSLIVGTIGATITGFFFYLAVVCILWQKIPEVYLKVDGEVVKNLIRSPVGLLGFWAASIASALGCFLSAPRTLKAVAQDGVLPKWLEIFSSKEETSIRTATLFTASLALLGSYFGSVQYVMPLLTMWILIVYGLLNLASGVEEFISNPSWRPTIRLSPYLSLTGAFLCFSAIVLMDSGKAFIACALLIALCFIVKKSVLESRFDDLRQTMLFSIVRFAIYRLTFLRPSIRSWRPNFLVLSENASCQSRLLHFTGAMAKGKGFVTLASVLKKTYAEIDEIEKWEELIRQNLKKRSLEALVEVTIAENIADGLKNIVANYGLGPLVPNTVVLGQCGREELFDNYMQILQIASDARRNILVFRSDIDLTGLEKKEIDIWWDEHQKQHTDLMVILANLLVREKEWRGATITLKSIVSNEVAKANQKLYFEEFFQKSRLDMKSEIYLLEPHKSTREMIPEHSTKKGVVFVGMKELGADYYKEIVRDFQSIPTICFVANCSHINLHTLLT